MGRNLVEFLWSPKEEPTYPINDTIHSACRQIDSGDRQKKKKNLLAHQAERHIQLYQACIKNKFNNLSPHLTSISYNKNLAPETKVPSSSPTTLLSQNW